MVNCIVFEVCKIRKMSFICVYNWNNVTEMCELSLKYVKICKMGNVIQICFVIRVMSLECI